MAETTSRKKSGWLLIFGVAVAILVLFGSLLPIIISTDWSRDRILGIAAPKIPGTVSVDDWSLSWFGRQHLSGLHYSDPDSGVDLETAEITVTKGLFSLLLDRGDVGIVTITQPEIHINLPAPVSTGPESASPSEPGAPQEKKTETTQKGGPAGPASQPMLSPLTGTVVVEQGQLAISRGGGDARPVAHDITAEIVSSSPAEEGITYSLSMVSPDGAGTVSGNGIITIQEAGTLLDTLDPVGELDIAGWEISHLVDLAALFGLDATGSGVLDTSVSFAGPLADSLKVEGAITVSDLELSGGPLGDDHPSIAKTSVTFTGSTNLERIEISAVQITSPLADGSLSAIIDPAGTLECDADLQVNLPFIATQFPHSLNLQQGLHITDGTLAITADARANGGLRRFDVSTLVENLAGTRNTREISLDQPFSFRLKGSQGGSTLSLDSFSVQSSFLQGEGQGNLDNLQLALQADLGATLEEVSKFIALQDYLAEGTLALSVEARRRDATTVDVSARLDSENLLVRQRTNDIIPQKPLHAEASSALQLSDDFNFSGLTDATLSYQSWLGSGRIAAESWEHSTQKVSGIGFTGKTDLTGLAALLHNLKLLPPELSFSGTETSTVKIDYSPKRIEIGSLHTEIEAFSLNQMEKTYQDSHLVVDATGIIDMENRRVSVSPISIDSANGAITLEQLDINNWDDLPNTLDSRGHVRFDLNTLLGAAGDWVSLPPDVSTTATVDLNWTVTPRTPEEHHYVFNADLNNFSLERGALHPFSNEQLSLQIEGLREPATGRVDVDRFSVSSPLLTLDGDGFYSAPAESNTEIEFSGNLAMDLARIASLIRTFSDMDLEMAGKSEHPFELAIKASPEQGWHWWQNTRFSGGFTADQISMMGVELRSIEIPIQVSEGYAQAEIQGSANNGMLHLQPQVDLSTTPPVLSIPDNSLVLDDMQITPAMANQLLARIHPLFMGATQMDGSMDLNLEHFTWPVGKENMNEIQFAGTMDLQEMRLGSSALLGSLLQVLRVDETGLDLSGQQIRFDCADGRITTNPLRTNLSDSELVISGSLGLDTTIDYVAQTEVTQRLVGGDLYDYLEGTVITVPIGGTLSKPDISAQTVQRAVTDLINQAGQNKLQEAAGSLLKKLF